MGIPSTNLLITPTRAADKPELCAIPKSLILHMRVDSVNYRTWLTRSYSLQRGRGSKLLNNDVPPKVSGIVKGLFIHYLLSKLGQPSYYLYGYFILLTRNSRYIEHFVTEQASTTLPCHKL